MDRVGRVIKKILTSYEFYFSVLIIYYEIFFHMLKFSFSFKNIFTLMLFSVCYGTVLGFIASLLPKKSRVIYTIIVSFVLYFYFIAHLIYNYVFNSFLSLSGVGDVAGQALDFRNVVFKALLTKIVIVLLWLLPILFYIIFGRKLLNKERHKLLTYGYEALFYAIFTFYIFLFLSMGDNGYNSAYHVFKNYDSVDLSIEKLGIVESVVLDTKYAAKSALGFEKQSADFADENGFDPDYVPAPVNPATVSDASAGDSMAKGDEEPTTEETTEEPVDTSPNILDVDFDKIDAEAGNGNITAINEYLRTAQTTHKNEYTGMFEGYNLIFVCAEGFNGYVVSETTTPTLYKMMHKGFYFTNYYTPLWYGSTSGGEYANLTGLLPRSGGYLSMNKLGSIGAYMPFTLGNQSKRAGYNVFAFHDNDYTYYKRQISHPYLGYDNWTGVGNGLPFETNSNGRQLWPQSDLFMEQNTFDLYKDQEPFHVYYMTVSGHLPYTYSSNSMSVKHKDYVENMPYSESTRAYIACQYELELMMKALLDDLEKEGIADHTLIVLVPDHVPYNNKSIVDELAGKTLDNTFGWYKNAFILYSPSMEHRTIVTKYCMSLDVLPTVSNLMGFKYDSRMLAGQDVMSTNEGLVILNDGSFITDSCRYNAGTGEVTGNVDDSYIDYYKNVCKNKRSVSDAILVNNYYKYIEEYIEEPETDEEDESDEEDSDDEEEDSDEKDESDDHDGEKEEDEE